MQRTMCTGDLYPPRGALFIRTRFPDTPRTQLDAHGNKGIVDLAPKRGWVLEGMSLFPSE